MTTVTRGLSDLSIDQVQQIAEASETWQREQQARLDAAGVGEQMGDGRALIGARLTRGEPRGAGGQRGREPIAHTEAPPRSQPAVIRRSDVLPVAED